MGTEVSLDINGNTIDWSKNGIGVHHGPLFQEKDRVQLPSNEDDEEDAESLAYQRALSRPLRTIVPRLEMLGVRLDAVRRDYDRAAIEWRELQDGVADGETGEPIRPVLEPLPFDQFLAFIRAHPINSLDGKTDWSIEPGTRERNKGRFVGSELIARIPNDGYHQPDPYSEQSYFVEVINVLGSHATLRLLAECPANLDLQVEWGYGPLVENGWVAAEDVYAGPRREQRTLVATEGSSDVHVLTRALDLLRPDVADFFSFVDVSDGHPFSGTGNLANFAKGLAKIDVQNRIVFLFDNDAEGVDAAARVRQFSLPDNMRVLVLPDLEEFQQFPVQGPDGVSNSDINGRAAAIECYLDLRLADRPAARAEWTNITKNTDIYQGALQYKETYTKAFLKQTAETIRDGTYDTSKMERLLDALIEECSHLAMRELDTD